MNTIGSHPGAIRFRLAVMVILILILIAAFFSYLDGNRRALEKTTILQTKRIIDSSLAVVFATYAAKGKLNDLNQLDGGNPFVFLAEYRILPPAYRGELDVDLNPDFEPGWYYLRHIRQVGYKSFYLDTNHYFAVVLDYEDRNKSNRFEHGSDRFKNLYFVESKLAQD